LDLSTLIPAVLFASVFLLGKRLREPNHHGAKRALVSAAAGVSVAYVFLHIFPALEGMRRVAVEETPGASHPFGGRLVYLFAMVGFLVFYGLERAMAKAEALSHGEGASGAQAVWWLRHIQLCGFGAYVAVVSYFLVRGPERAPLAAVLYASAMTLHFLSMAYNLRREHGPAFDRGPAFFLAGCVLAGWVCGTLAEIPVVLLIALISLVIGAILVNTMITELSKGDEGLFVPFGTGALLYAWLLLFAH
jgi:hypothetical protein